MTPAERARLAALAEAATPGPWEVHRESDGSRVTYYGMTVAWCGTSLAISREGRWEITREQAHANADLFAAVPDLLAALADAEAERARAHDAINQLAKETAYSDVLNAALDRVALALHPDKSPDEAWTYSTGDLPVMACDLRARAERAEAMVAKLEAVAEAARVMLDVEGCDCGAYGCACFAAAKADTTRALAALDGGSDV